MHWRTLLTGLALVYAAYTTIIVVKLYVDRDTRPTRGDRDAHLLIWLIALAWLPVLVYYLTQRTRLRLRMRRAERKLDQILRDRLAARTHADTSITGRYRRAPRMQEIPHSFSTHPDAAFGGREQIRLCFDPDCNCRGHERDPHYDPNMKNPEDYWR